jgi:hypothetical protein
MELIKIPSNAEVTVALSRNLRKGMLCYHRNIGGEWERLPLEAGQQRRSETLKTFTETSFLIWVPTTQDSLFCSQYTKKPPPATPTLGQLFSCTYNSVDPTMSSFSAQPSEVCLLHSPDPNQFLFAVLDGEANREFSLPRSEFQGKYADRFKKNSGRKPTSNRRAGIGNMGNTCYMNASIQAMLSVLSGDPLSKLEGPLGIELREIDRKIRSPSSSVFPGAFKTKFDSIFSDFQGHEQHDAHEFCLRLLEQL